MSKKLDLIGKRIGRLVVKEEYISISKSGRKYSRCKCICDCGKEKNILKNHLINRKIISCGCYRSEKIKERKEEYKNISGTTWNSIKRGAKVRNIEFNITPQEAYQIFLNQNKKCALFGIDLVISNCAWRSKNNKYKKCVTYIEGNASLDRIDSTKGYTIDNVQWVDKNINIGKQCLSNEDFITMCKTVTKYQENIKKCK